jgi:MFS family permease
MKLVGLVFLGLIASVVVYIPLFMLLTTVFSNIDEQRGILIVAFAVTPFAFLIGSMITGYFSYYDIEDKWLLVWMAPALYLELLGLFGSGVAFLLDAFIGVNAPPPGSWRYLWVPVVMGLLWYIASTAGVFLGYLLRQRIVKWWYGD